MIKDVNCKNKVYKMDDLDRMIFNEISKLAVDDSYISELKQEKKDSSGTIKTLQKEISKLENQRSRFMDLYGYGTFSADDLLGKIEPLNEQIRNLSKEIESMQSEKPLPEETALKILSSWESVLNSGDFYLIKSLINSLIEKIEIDGEEITIYWRFT